MSCPCCRVFAVSLSCLCRVFVVSLPCLCRVVVRATAVSLLRICSTLRRPVLMPSLCARVLGLFDGAAVFSRCVAVCCASRPAPSTFRALRVLPAHWFVYDGAAPWDLLRASLQTHALKPRPATWQGLSGLVQAHLQVALRGDLEKFTALAWQNAVLFAVVEHHVETRFVGTLNPSERKGADPALIESAEARVAVHVAPPLQTVATLGQICVENPPWVRGRLTMPSWYIKLVY